MVIKNRRHFLKQARVTGRNVLYNKLMRDLKSFPYLEVEDKIFTLNLLKHKLQEKDKE